MSKIINLIKRLSLGYPLLVIILSLIACWNLFRPGYFSMHDDIQVIRLLEMEKCFQDGQIPCRWAPDMGAGFGYPLFNYYSGLPYYLGQFFRIFSFSFISIVKVLFGLSFVLSGVFMYFLAAEFFGQLGGLLAAVFYLYAPYRAVDVFVRGALAESWGLVFFPLIFWSMYRYIKERNLSWYLWSVISLTLLFLSHNIMSMIFIPAIGLWTFFWLLSEKRKPLLTFSIFIWAIGLAAFYLIPAYFEKSLVNISWLINDYFDFRNHFVSIKQLFFSRSWGYGPSVFGPQDTISFQLGIIHWLAVVLAGVIILRTALFKKLGKRKLFLFVILGGLWLFSTFMTHARSIFIWERFNLLSFVQFPWRFLGLAMFLGSFITATIPSLIEKVKAKRGIALIVIVLVIVLNIGYFKPEHYYPEKTDQAVLSGKSWEEQSRGALLDYLPRSVKIYPEGLAPASPWLVEGSANITEFAKRSDFWRFTIETIGNQPSVVAVPVFDFPNWEILIDQKLTPYTVDNTGVIRITIPLGKHTVVGWFKNTPLRSLANFVTLVSFFGLMALVVIKKDEKFG